MFITVKCREADIILITNNNTIIENKVIEENTNIKIKVIKIKNNIKTLKKL